MKIFPEVKIQKRNNIITSIAIDGEEWTPFLSDVSISCSNEFTTDLILTIPCSRVEISDTYK